MPTAAPKPCTVCAVLVTDGTTRCAGHKVRAGSFSDRQRGSRHERGYGSDWVRRRERILKRDNGLCQIGLRRGDVHVGNEVDHKVPKAQGGTDDDENLQLVCRVCHREKTQQEALQGQAHG